MNLPFKYRVRQWLLGPNVRQLGLFVSVGGAMMGLSWMMRPDNPADVDLLRFLRIASIVCFLTPILAMIWTAKMPDPVPDFLGGIAPAFFERDGFCFLVSVQKDEGHARMTVFYQNRFSQPSTAKVFIGPTPKALANLDGLPKFEFQITCESGGFGSQSVAWAVPARWEGKKVLWDVAAQVKYPAGRGLLLRGKNGIKVGDHLVGAGEEAVKALSGLFLGAAHLHGMPQGRGRVETLLPTGMISLKDQPWDLQVRTVWKLGDPVKKFPVEKYV